MTTEDIENYRKMVDSTSDRLQNLCEYWSGEMAENENIGEEIVQRIHSVIGKSQLLINSKFKQFRGFLNDAEQKTIGKVVKHDDIRGFWETISIQVDQVEKTFEELSRLKSDNYCESTATNEVNGNVKKPIKKTQLGKKPVAFASSNLKNFISAQRERAKLGANEVEIRISEKLPTNGHT